MDDGRDSTKTMKIKDKEIINQRLELVLTCDCVREHQQVAREMCWRERKRDRWREWHECEGYRGARVRGAERWVEQFTNLPRAPKAGLVGGAVWGWVWCGQCHSRPLCSHVELRSLKVEKKEQWRACEIGGR